MIFVTIQVISARGPRRDRVPVTVRIGNEGRHERGGYNYSVSVREGRRLFRGRVENFPRSRGARELVQRALNASLERSET